MINYNGENTIIDEILEEQGYSIVTVEARVRDRILDSERFFNIYYASEGDFADSTASKIIEDFIKNFITSFIIDEIDPNSEFDHLDTIDNIIDENLSEFNSLDEELSSYGDRQRKSWEDEINDLNSYYYQTR